MRAMILAAGRGERLRPLTDDLPKPLVEVAGKPLIQYHVERLAAAGIAEIVINVSYLAQKIMDKLGDGQQFNVKITYSIEDEPLEVVGGIIQALPLLGSETFMIVNADIWTDYPFQTLIKKGLAANKLAHLVLVNTTTKHPLGDFGLEGNKLLERAEKQYIYSGIALFSPQFFANLPPGKCKALSLFKQAIQEDTITAEYYDGEWYDIGTVECWKKLNERLWIN